MSLMRQHVQMKDVLCVRSTDVNVPPQCRKIESGKAQDMLSCAALGSQTPEISTVGVTASSWRPAPRAYLRSITVLSMAEWICLLSQCHR